MTSQALMPVTFASTLNIDSEQGEAMSMESEGRWHLEYHCVQTPQVYLDYQVYEDRGGLLLKWDMVDEIFPEVFLRDVCCLLPTSAISSQ